MFWFHRSSHLNTPPDQKPVLSTVLEAISDGIVVVSVDGIVQMVNGYARTLLGARAKDVVGKPIFGLFTLENEKGVLVSPENAPWRRVLEQKKSIGPAQYTIVKTDGGKTPIALSVSPFFGQDEKTVEGVVIAFEDKTTEEEVEQMKTKFIPFAAHQLRTPLGSIRWNTEIILSGKLGIVPPYLIDTITTVYDSTQQMIRLVNDLLNLSRIDEGKIPNDPVDIDVAVVIRSVVKEMQTLVEKRALTTEVTVPDVLPKLRLDASRFRDVIQNIVSNAVKFNMPGGKVTISVTSSEDHIEILIADTGMGIPQIEQKQIFEKFFRAANAVANQTEGTGLGLYVIKYYMDEWGGSIILDSEENKGTTVRLSFPI